MKETLMKGGHSAKLTWYQSHFWIYIPKFCLRYIGLLVSFFWIFFDSWLSFGFWIFFYSSCFGLSRQWHQTILICLVFDSLERIIPLGNFSFKYLSRGKNCGVMWRQWSTSYRFYQVTSMESQRYLGNVLDFRVCWSSYCS